MLAVFSQADALIVVAIITSSFGAIQSILNGRKLKPNGGSSPVDALNRIERDVKEVAADVKQLHVRVDQLEEFVTNPPASGHIRRRKETA